MEMSIGLKWILLILFCNENKYTAYIWYLAYSW